MARTARGQEVLSAAREALKQAHTVAELRQAQAVILPLEFGFSLEQVAMVTGISKGWVCQLRNRFIRLAGTPDLDKRKPGGRRHENMSREEEAAFLAPFFEKAAQGGILVVREIKQALDAHLGRTVPLSTVYNLLHRHNWPELGSVLSGVAVASVGLAAVVGFASAALLSTGAGLAVTAGVFSSA